MTLHAILSISLLGLATAAQQPVCRYRPSDASWPSPQEWSALDAAVDGRLVETVPLGTPCHDPNYDEAACEVIRQRWVDPMLHVESTHSPLHPLWSNWSCDPFTDRALPCELGPYPKYVVNATTQAHIVSAIEFAREKNVRLVVKNTGHDPHGRSAGAHSLAIWTHHMRSIEEVDWSDEHYTGKALKLGGGVMISEAVEFASDRGLFVVCGNAASVGIAGGYLQGGGHSPLSSKYGLAADNALEFEVIDGKGDYHVASSTQNTDLFWALRGGGGGTYAVVLSATVKAHPEPSIGFGTLKFPSEGLSNDEYIDAVELFHTILPSVVEAGGHALYFFNRQEFDLSALIAPDKSVAEIEGLLEPFVSHLDSLNVTYEKQVAPFPNFKALFDLLSAAPEASSVANVYGGGWFMPRSAVLGTNTRHFVEENLAIQDAGSFIIFMGWDMSKKEEHIDNAVHPGWRDLLVFSVLITPWSVEWGHAEAEESQRVYVDELQPRFHALAPGAGTYYNEGFFIVPDWKESFFGGNYDRLLGIKQTYDPDAVFWSINSVGSDLWELANDGQLCRVDQSGNNQKRQAKSSREEL